MSKKKILVKELYECSICFDFLKKNTIKLNCDHIFHKKCISDWCYTNKNIIINQNNHTIINGVCPICNSPFFININKNNTYNDCCCYIL